MPRDRAASDPEPFRPMTALSRAAGPLAALLLLAACAHDPTAADRAADRAAADIAGDWGPQTSLVGSRWTMHLHAHDAALAGTGEYAFEAGRSGTFVVTGVTTGSAADAHVTLDIAYDYGVHDRFTGSRTPLDILHGQLVRVAGTDTLTIETDYYRRAPQ